MRTIKFKSLSSGSCGNCYYLGAFNEDGSCEGGIVIDAGVSPRRLKKEMEKDGLSPDDYAGLIITHDHHDHIGSLGSYCKHLGKPVWATPELHRAMSRKRTTGPCLTECRRFLQEGWNEIVPGLVSVQYFAVPHDASYTYGYAIIIDGYRFVIMTDIGRMVPQAMSFATQADTVVIESNYDMDMLLKGPYTEDLKKRIRSGFGHLSNTECAEAIREFMHEGLRNIFLCHLSDHNNTPQLAVQANRTVLDSTIPEGSRPPRLVALPRMTPSPLFIL